MVQLHFTDDVAQGGGRQALDGRDGLVDAVGVELGIHDLEEDHGVDLHGDVVTGDDRLGREVGDLLLQADLFGHPLHERDLDVQAGAPAVGVAAQPLDDVGHGLGHDDDVGDDDEKDDEDQCKDHKQHDGHRNAPFFSGWMIRSGQAPR